MQFRMTGELTFNDTTYNKNTKFYLADESLKSEFTKRMLSDHYKRQLVKNHYLARMNDGSYRWIPKSLSEVVQ